MTTNEEQYEKMMTKSAFRPSKNSEFSMNPNSFCRIENMLNFGKLLIISCV